MWLGSAQRAAAVAPGLVSAAAATVVLCDAAGTSRDLAMVAGSLIAGGDSDGSIFLQAGL